MSKLSILETDMAAEEFKLVLPADQIPEGATVTKRTGEKEYTLTRVLKIYGGKVGEDQVIAAADGAVFLSDGPTINAYPGTTLLGWVVSEDELFGWLEARQEGTPPMTAERIPGLSSAFAAPYGQPKFKRGDRVRKTKGSSWHGTVVGEYSTELTPEGYAVESATEKGSVQIYPAAALKFWRVG